MKKPIPPEAASAMIDAKIKSLADWRGKTLARVREIVLKADPEIVEQWKWMGSPTWSHAGIIAVATVLKDKLKLTFAHGASLPDPDKIFNAGLTGGTWRAIDFHEGDAINQRALKNLIGDGAAFNLNSKDKKKLKPKPRTKKPRTKSRK